MRAETYIGGAEAVKAGFADSVMEREAQMPVYASADSPKDKASSISFSRRRESRGPSDATFIVRWG
ncbi:hypothetical protein GCM10020258_34250 [Sphingomonas yabuuchiae]